MDAEFAPGEHLGERYQIVEPLGNGGFAQVYRGIQLGMNRPVAIKVMAPKLDGIKASGHDAALKDFARRFEKEAQVLSTLHDPSTVTVHDYGVTDEGIPYMILELVQGTSLDRLDAHDLPMPSWRVVKILTSVLESLREAHFLSILHRDIKPANIMIFEHMGEHERVKVLDFGMAKIYQGDAQGDVAAETQNGMLIGTPRYMAPELIREPEKAGPGSDIYSLGLVCYELLTGTRAIADTETMLQISRQLDDSSITLPTELEILPALRQIIDRMLDKDIETRWQGAQHIINALNQHVLPHIPKETPKTKRVDNPLLKSLTFTLPTKPKLPPREEPEELEEDDASTITLTEEVVVSAMSATRGAAAPLTKTAPRSIEAASLFDPDDASPSPSGIRMPVRPILHSSLLPPPPSHTVAQPLRAATISQPLDVLHDERLRKRIDSSHNVAAPLDPLPLSWDDNEVTPPPSQPDKTKRVIVLDSPSGRHPISTTPQAPVAVSPRPAQPTIPPDIEGSALIQLDMDQKWLAIQRRNQLLSALLLLVVLGVTLYVIVQYLL